MDGLDAIPKSRDQAGHSGYVKCLLHHLSYQRPLKKRSFVLCMSRHFADLVSTVLLYLMSTFNSTKGEQAHVTHFYLSEI